MIISTELSQIDLIQVINESFLINDDTLNIFKLEFIKTEKSSDIDDEKDLVLIFTDIIKIDKIDENDKKDLFIRIFETDENKADKDD